tara:strand:+ start:4830 stop:6710 length:1881 start_codon:yes stop_codon:yes gene_type:complete
MKQTMTFGIKTEGVAKAKSDIDGVASASKNAEAAQEDLNESVEEGGVALGGMAGGAITAFKGVVGGVKKAVLGMRTLKGAMMATGIGALVVLVASLMMYFTKTKKGAEVLQVATAGLGAVFGVMTDVLSKIGETMVWAFNSPQEAIQAVSDKIAAVGAWFSDLGNYLREVFLFSMLKIKRSFLSLAAASAEFLGFDASDMRAEIRSIDKELNASVERMEIASDKVTAPLKEAWDNVVEGVTNFIETVSTAIKSATALEKRAVALADAQRALGVEFAQTRQAIREQKIIAEDINETFEKRIAALQKAGTMESDLAAKSLALAQEAVDIKRAQNDITESTAEDLQALADLEIALAQAQTESLGKQTELMMKLNALYTAQGAAIKAIEDAEQKRISAMIASQKEIDDILTDAQTLELQKIEAFWKKKRDDAKLQSQILIGDKEAEQKQIDAVNKKYAVKEIAAVKVTTQQKLSIAAGLLGSLMALNSALAGSSKREQKDAFQRNKKMGIVSAVINTAGAIIGAINPAAGGIPLPWGAVGAAAAAISGAAQIAVIAKSRFASPDQTVPPPPSAGGGGGGGASSAAASANPQLDLSFMGEGAGGSVQAYVISENVTNQQQADQIVTDQTTL